MPVPPHIYMFPALSNLALSPHIAADELCNVAMALRDDMPRWEELAEDIPFTIVAGEPREELPVYCFNCGRIRDTMLGGHIRATCAHCHSSPSESRRNPSAFLWALSSATGYPTEVWQYFLLTSIASHHRKAFK